MKLSVGNPAPEIVAKNEKGENLSLADYRGKKVVLYFYPKDDTPTCTTQACNLRDNYASLLANGYVVLGISPDTEKKHQKFITKYDLPFSLLADTDHQIAENYGVWGEKKLYGRTYMGIIRTTFLIDEQGIISNIIEKIDAQAHSQQVLA